LRVATRKKIPSAAWSKFKGVNPSARHIGTEGGNTNRRKKDRRKVKEKLGEQGGPRREKRLTGQKSKKRDWYQKKKKKTTKRCCRLWGGGARAQAVVPLTVHDPRRRGIVCPLRWGGREQKTMGADLSVVTARGTDGEGNRGGKAPFVVKWVWPCTCRFRGVVKPIAKKDWLGGGKPFT